jgi:hypothetical protein
MSRGSAFAFHSGRGIVIVRPEPPFRRKPSGSVIIHRTTPVFFVHPFLFGHRFTTFGTFGAALFLDWSAATVIDTPFFCDVDGLGFPDEAAFAQHLHDAHGIPLDSALSVCEPVGT